jgi:hypothetical protein
MAFSVVISPPSLMVGVTSALDPATSPLGSRQTAYTDSTCSSPTNGDSSSSAVGASLRLSQPLNGLSQPLNGKTRTLSLDPRGQGGVAPSVVAFSPHYCGGEGQRQTGR